MRDIYIKDQQRKLTAGQINRRQFMVSVLATGIAASTALSLASEAEASTPKKGGTFRYGVGHGSTTDTLDSGTSENHFTLVNTYNIANVNIRPEPNVSNKDDFDTPMDHMSKEAREEMR